MNKWYRKLEQLTAKTRTENAAYFAAAGNQSDPRTDPAFNAIWKDFDNGVASIRNEIAGAVSENLLDASALAAYDEITRAVNEMACRRGPDWTDKSSAAALVGAESVIAMGASF